MQGAEPAFFLDYFASGKLDTGVAARVIAGIAEGCRTGSIAASSAARPQRCRTYAPGDYDLARFCLGAAERGSLLPREDIAQGDLVIGVASTGVHSNGFSLVRKIVAMPDFPGKTRHPFSRDLASVRHLSSLRGFM